MKNVVLNYVTRCDKEETEVEFTVQGRKVTGVFPSRDNTSIYQKIKHILVNAYMGNLMPQNAIF